MQILFIPGIKGVELYNGDKKVWFPRTLDDLRTVGENTDLKSDGALGMVNGYGLKKVHIYDALLDQFPADQLTVFSYDWRKSLMDHAPRLVSEVLRLAKASDDGKIAIVAHSMGGMLAKIAINALEEVGRSDAIDRLVTIATPWRGSPDSYKALVHGERGIFEALSEILGLFDWVETREVARRCPSVYQLLPSKEYFAGDTGKFAIGEGNESFDYVKILQAVQGYFNRDNDPDSRGNFTNVVEEYILPVHAEMLKPISVPHDCLISTELPTVAKVPEKAAGGIRFKPPAAFVNGDGVVPLASALPPHEAQQYFVEGIHHRELCAEPVVIQFIRWCIEGKQGTIPASVGTSLPEENIRVGFLTSIMCPVDYTLLDQDGKYVAGVFDTSVEDISSLFYSDMVRHYAIGEANYLFFSEEVNTDLDFSISAYDTGIAEVAIQPLEDSGEELRFDPIPVSRGSVVKMTIPRNNLRHAQLEHNGVTTRPAEVSVAEISNDALPPLPKFKISLRPKDDSVRQARRRHVYSGSIVLSVECDSDLVDAILYSVNGALPVMYAGPVQLDLPTGEQLIRVFGRDKYKRPLNEVEQIVVIDDAPPSTKLEMTLRPDGLSLIFKPITNGSHASVYYRVIRGNVGEQEWVELENGPIFETHLEWGDLAVSSNAVMNIEYYSRNGFGNQEEMKSIGLSLGNIPVLMWDNYSSHVTPQMIWRNVIRSEDFVIDDAEIFLIPGAKRFSPEGQIPDNVSGVKFESKNLSVTVMYAEKYALYFNGAPTEILQIGQVYKFSFQLLTGRTNDPIVHTHPRARLHASRSRLEDDKHLPLEEMSGVFYGEFIVDQTFADNKYKLIITDQKNIAPPLREIPLTLKDMTEK